MEMINHFTTDRLEIRPIMVSDASFMTQLMNSPGWLEYIGDRQIDSEVAAVGYIQRISSLPDTHYWTVMEIASGLQIGILTYMKRDYLSYWDLGFAFLPVFQGQGLAFEAAMGLLGQLRAGFPGTAIAAVTVPHNQRSTALLLRMGFEQDSETSNGLALYKLML